MIICSPQLGIDPNSVLGGEVFDREILLGLARKQVKIKIILPRNKPHDKKIKNWDIIYIPIVHFPAIIFNLLIAPYLFLVYRKEKFSIIRLHQPQFIGFGSLFFKIFHREVKLVATYHQFRESNFGPLSKMINKLWDHVICDSLAVKHKISRLYNINGNKISVVHNGVPLYLKPSSKDQKLVKRLQLEDKIVLLFMGLFTERKNPLFLLDVLSQLLQMRPGLVLIFWGRGPLRTKILQKASQLQLSQNIRIINPIHGPDKNKIHNLCDIFVHPSVDEGFALAPLEAMACAKPIIINDAHSARELIENGKNGFFCKKNNLNDWVKKINKLVKNKKLRQNMGGYSAQRVKYKFQWESTAREHFKIYQKIVKNNS